MEPGSTPSGETRTLLNSFSNSYVEAREKFLRAAHEAGATVHTYQQPGVTGKDGEPLACDVAVLGPTNANTACVVISGTHGAEGYCGSAIQHRWLLTSGTTVFKRGPRIVLVHAISPWAFSHQTRTTENNVDLNRNFLSHKGDHATSNPSYDLLAPFLHTKAYSAAECLEAFEGYRSCLDQNGAHIENELIAGQSHRADGLFYTGNAPEWANGCFRQIINDQLAGIEEIGFIDWHTGVGRYGEIVYLCFDDPGSAEYQAAADWWALKKTEHEAFSSGCVPQYNGLLCQAIRQELPTAMIAGAVIEFGTGDAYSLFRSDRLDRWLRFEGSHDANYARHKCDYCNAICPDELAWRAHVLEQGPRIMDRMIAGLSRN